MFITKISFQNYLIMAFFVILRNHANNASKTSDTKISLCCPKNEWYNPNTHKCRTISKTDKLCTSIKVVLDPQNNQTIDEDIFDMDSVGKPNCPMYELNEGDNKNYSFELLKVKCDNCTFI